MKNGIQNHFVTATVLVTFVLAIVFGTWLVHYNQRELEASLRKELESEREILKTLADTTNRNGTVEGIDVIVHDCSSRSEYEGLLVRLSTLSMTELLKLQDLSDACGGFYAEQKAFMVARLERELSAYNSYLTLLSKLSTHNIDFYKQDAWKELVSLEQLRSTLLTDQKNIQAEIITARINGESLNSPSMNERIKRAQEINELLSVYNKKIAGVRAELVP